MVKQTDHHFLRPDPEGVMSRIKEGRNSIILLLDRIEDPANIGSIFRIADAARLEEIILLNCPDIQSHKKMVRSSRNTIYTVSFREIRNPDQINSKYPILGIEQTDSSVSYHQHNPIDGITLALGNEVHGISQEVLDLCRATIHIPMLGMNSSMNVAMAGGIVIFDFLSRLGKLGIAPPGISG